MNSNLTDILNHVEIIKRKCIDLTKSNKKKNINELIKTLQQELDNQENLFNHKKTNPITNMKIQYSSYKYQQNALYLEKLKNFKNKEKNIIPFKVEVLRNHELFTILLNIIKTLTNKIHILESRQKI